VAGRDAAFRWCERLQVAELAENVEIDFELRERSHCAAAATGAELELLGTVPQRRAKGECHTLLVQHRAKAAQRLCLSAPCTGLLCRVFSIAASLVREKPDSPWKESVMEFP